MPNGFGRGTGVGRGFGRGMGFGFRVSSPPWPYVGRGRGGLPRRGYFLSGAGMPVPPGYPFDGSPGAVPYYGGMAHSGAMPGAYSYAPQMTREQELDFLKSQAEAIKGQLEQIDARIRDLEAE